MGRPSERKATLLVAAQRAIAEHGTGVRLNQIAEMAGVSSSSILYHYPEIEELLIEANRAGMERFYNQRLGIIASIADPAERLHVTITLGVPHSAQDEEVRLLLRPWWRGSKEHCLRAPANKPLRPSSWYVLLPF